VEATVVVESRWPVPTQECVNVDSVFPALVGS